MKAMGCFIQLLNFDLWEMQEFSAGNLGLFYFELKIFEEMRRYEVKPTRQTYICLLNSRAAAGRLDQV
ncbi:unnamed protein product [Camellia sinensis]